MTGRGDKGLLITTGTFTSEPIRKLATILWLPRLLSGSRANRATPEATWGPLVP